MAHADTQAVNMKNEALKLASEGFHIIPLRGKIPVTRSGSKDATLSYEQIDKWWTSTPDANIGIATGLEHELGGKVIVIDVDGPEGEASMQRLVQDHGPLPPSLRVKTGGGGWHLYFRVPLEADVRNSQAQKQGWSKIDIRGTGGYVVAPPSLHDSGERYSWHDHNKYPGLAMLDGIWLGLLTKKERPGQTTLTATIVDGESKSEKINVVEGGRNTYLTSKAGEMRALGMPGVAIAAALKELNRRECKPPLDADEVERIANGMERYHHEDKAKLGIHDLEAAKGISDRLEELYEHNPAAAMEPDVVAAMSILKDEDLGEYARACILIKKKGQMRWLEQAIKQHRAKQAQDQMAKLKEHTPMDDEPIKLVIPDKFQCSDSGVWAIVGDGDGDSLERVLPVPLLIVNRMKDVRTGDERITLTWKRDNDWHETHCEASTTASAQKIIALADHGLPIDSTSAMNTVRYLTALAAANPQIPVVKLTRTTGWLGSSQFYPGAAEGIEYAPDDFSLKHGLTPAGELGDWVGIIAPLREQYPAFRLQLSASFAGPLLQKVGGRGFVAHIWGRSGGGKTATLLAAASVWGSESTMKSFMTTRYALTVAASQRNGLPLCINEKQLATFRADRVLYELVEGVSKGQGAKSGGLREELRWLCPILTNGESPIVDYDSEQGTQTRSLDIECEPITDEATAASLYGLLKENHGTAGPEFARNLVTLDTEVVKADHKKIVRLLEADHSDYTMSHVATIGTIALADYYSNKWVFGFDDNKALANTIAWANKFIEQHLDRKQDINQGESAYEMVCEVIHANLGEHVATSKGAATKGETWGFISGDYCYILPYYLRKIIDGSGHNSNTRPFLRELNRMGLIKSEHRGGKTRYGIRGSGGVLYNVISISVNSITHSEESDPKNVEVY